MADIFISYAREDLERVRPIVGAIEGSGYSVFWDRQVPSGLRWRQYIDNALAQAKCVVVVWSKTAIVSEYVEEEADDGRDREILVPVLIDEVRPPLGFRSIQCEDFRGWNGDPDHPRVKSLLNSIVRVAGGKATHEKQAFQGEKVVKIPAKQGTRHSASHHPDYAQMAITNEVDGYELVKITVGTFMMGSPADEKDRIEDEGLRREVQVPGFFIGRYPVTNAQYQRFLKANPKAAEPRFWADRDYNQPRQPVVGVSWEDARAYARWAGLRLPTEAEWEYACRAGTTTRFFLGDTEKDLAAAGWYFSNSEGRLHPVGEKVSNGFGLYDMHGNVWEWVEDDWHGNYQGAPTDGSAWVDRPRAAVRVFRGGSWHFDAPRCRSAARNGRPPFNQSDDIGFRLARSVDSGS